MHTPTFTIVTLFIILIHVPPSLSSHPHADIGFMARLIHCDSPLSPFYNPNAISLHNHTMAAHHRSDSRLYYFQSCQSRSSSINVPNAPLQPTLGEYVMSFYMGTPPIMRWAIIDSGSSLLWVQCEPYVECYEMNQPLFDPSKSMTFDKVTCSDIFCEVEYTASCKPNTNVCIFKETFGDGTVTEGDAAYETFILEDTNSPNITLESIIFGCGHEITRAYDEDEAGLVGLSRDSYSFVRQIGALKLSYCLVPFYYLKTWSKILFGKQAQLTGNFTQML